jgi:uncharacterized protein
MIATTLYAALLALFYLALAINVIRTRGSAGVSLGDGGDLLLQRRIRAHGNFAEYVPIALILMVLAEIAGTATVLIHGLGLALVVGRAMHAFAMSSLTIRPVARVGGMVLTFAVIASAAITCLVAAGRTLGA